MDVLVEYFSNQSFFNKFLAENGLNALHLMLNALEYEFYTPNVNIIKFGKLSYPKLQAIWATNSTLCCRVR